MVVIDDVVLQLGQIGLWVQAVGLLVIIWIIVQTITLYYNRKRRLLLEEINKRLKRLETKVDKITDK
ncbi:MAG: hypothetical protein AABX23_03110 [Nanoarchaeota archaeon]